MEHKVLYWCLTAMLIYAHSVHAMWDFAVTTKSKILFFDEQWQQVTSAAHQFDQLSAITFDDTEEVVYFNDQLHNNGSIFSLKIPTSQNDPHIIEDKVQRTANETIKSIAYDPLNRNLYWTDAQTKKIYFISIHADESAKPKVLIDFANEEATPDGIAVDICRRKLYWTNSNFKNASIERIDLDGTEREVLVNEGLHLPHGIVIDQLSDRLYWVVDQQGVYFSVESSNLDGSDRHVIVRGLNNVPLNLAVTKDAIFWTDSTHNAVWSHPKYSNTTEDLTEEEQRKATAPQKVLSFDDPPRGIVARARFLTSMQNDIHCEVVVKKIKSRLLAPRPTRNSTDVKLEKLEQDYCLNDGTYIKQSKVCLCQIGFKGSRCETSECHNYCVHGSCTMSSMAFPKCMCQKGFYGERCQSYKCSGYCFNDGLCKIESNGEPSCECKENFGGQRCEQNNTEICSLFCRLLKHDAEIYVPFGCHDICEELSQLNVEEGESLYAIPTYKHLESCQKASTVWSETVILVIAFVILLCLCLILLIIYSVRRFYKPARPRIRKTFVVRKHTSRDSDTPLTNRPVATEQCEITIENCCNMNICDTPCFDPKLVQQSLTCGDGRIKEDKKVLIHNMEDELY